MSILKCVFVVAVIVSGCSEIAIDRTSPSAWYYERYKPSRDRVVRLPSGPALVQVFEGVHFAIPFYDDDGNDIGHADGWRTEVEVFFPKDQLPENSLGAAVDAVMLVCGEFEDSMLLEEHAHYIRLAVYCLGHFISTW